MTFWDSSAVMPLLVHEAGSAKREANLQSAPQLLVWYGTVVELESALQRRRREGALPPEEEAAARARLVRLRQSWAEIQPTPLVRDRAIRLLRVHPLRAADSLQLAAALIACSDQTSGITFLTDDRRLADAAFAEGFTVG